MASESGQSSRSPGVKTPEWADLLDQIRSLHGFDDFLKNKLTIDLEVLSSAGPVILLVPSIWGCFAILISDSQADAVELDITYAEIAKMADDLLSSRRSLSLAERNMHDLKRLADESSATNRERQSYQSAKFQLQQERSRDNERLRAVLDQLWTAVASIVVDRLRLNSPPKSSRLPRLWICSAGPFSALPIHAAEASTSSNNSCDSLLNQAVISYTPSASSLVRARCEMPVHTWANSRGNERGLAVALTDSPNQVPLNNVREEVRAMRTLLGSHNVTVLEGSGAIRGRVREGLLNSVVVHFSCHGQQDLADPTAGGLLMHDGMLTIDQVGSGAYSGQLAFVSACETASTGANIPDEAMTLASALHYRGYRQVIACMWSVFDSASAVIVDHTYTALKNRCSGLSESAYALHEAVCASKAKDALTPAVWATFTHTGP
jgi:CHAT domain-containing protein